MFGLGIKPVIIAAPPPTLTLATPNIGSSAGSWAITLTGTNFTGATGVTINGNACTSITVVNSTTITCVTPAYSTPNGSATGQTIAVTTPGGIVNSSAVANKYFYLPSNNTIEQFVRGDVGVTIATGVSQWSDQSGQGNHWTQVTGSAQPTVSSNFNSTGLSYLAFNGSSQYMTLASFAATQPTDCSIYMVGNYTTLNATTDAINFVTTGGAATAMHIFGISTPNVGGGDGISNIFIGSGSANTNPHVWGYINTGIGTSIFAQDGTNATGNAHNNQVFTGAGFLGSGSASASFAPVHVLAVLLYNGPISSGDQTTVNSILRTTSNI